MINTKKKKKKKNDPKGDFSWVVTSLIYVFIEGIRKLNTIHFGILEKYLENYQLYHF